MTEKIWTLAELVNALNAAIAKGNGNLYINNELKQELPALDVLLGYLGRDELLISDALLTQSPYDVTVSGTAFTFKEVLYNVRLVGSVVAGKEYFTLTSTPYNTTNWTFYSDFAPLHQYLTATDEGMISPPLSTMLKKTSAPG